MNRTGKILALLLILSFFTASGCGKDDHAVVGEPANGSVYEELSENFIFTIHPTRLILDDGQESIIFSVDIANDSEKSYRDFAATIIIDSELDPYLISGAIPFEFSKVNLAAKNETSLMPGESKGVELRFRQALRNEGSLREERLDYTDIEELAEEFEILLKWNGGEERYRFVKEVINELRD